jgi:hypothetical protein
MTGSRIIAALAGAGLFTGAAAWAVNQQAGYIIVGRICADTQAWLAGLSLVVLATLAAGAAISWRTLRQRPRPTKGDQDSIRPRRFMASVALMGAGLFCFAICLQIAAYFFLAPCVP